MARSEHVDRFNHDEDADDYDLDVRNEEDPIRAGYDELLAWVTGQVALLVSQEDHPDAGARVLEFGSGTGNLTVRLLTEAGVQHAKCVDVSARMTELAREKLSKHVDCAADRVQFLQCDLLETFEPDRLEKLGPPVFDAAVSTYTLHHLTSEEKARFVCQAAECLRPGGCLIVGDLAFEGAEQRAELLECYRASGQDELVEVIEDEFFWNLEVDLPALEEAGFVVRTKRFSDLSWGIHARLAAP